MKILLLKLWRIINLQGGAERVFCDMANALTQRGYEIVAVVCENKEGMPFFPLSKNVKFINAGIGYVKGKTFIQKMKRIFQGNKVQRHIFDMKVEDSKRIELLKPVIEREEPDIIISFNIEATRILKNGMYSSCPVITMFHGLPENYFEDCLYDEDTFKALELSECIQVLMPSFIENLKKYIKNDKVVCIPNVVYQHPMMVGDDKRNVIINVGRVDPNDKRQHLLIEAFNKIKNDYPDWCVEIWGDPDFDTKYYSFCCGLINKYQLKNKIRFCGTTNNIFEKLLKAKIFAFPSKTEGFGLALTEAMSVGLPSVAFKTCSAVNELIRDGHNGILCEETVEDFAEGLAELMDDADKRKRYGLHAKEDMKEYTPEKIWDQWQILIEKTVREYSRNSFVR